MHPWKIIAISLVAVALTADGPAAGIVSPRHGGPLPEGFLRSTDPKKGSSGLSRRWITSRRRSFPNMGGREIGSVPGGPSAQAAQGALTGALGVPVICGVYNDFTETPVSVSSIDRVLFEGFILPSTVADYFEEVSGGLFTVEGAVNGWVELAGAEDYYTGGFAKGVVPGVSRTDEMIAEVVAGVDDRVDFGLYDNDGPDGLPNSGDDDGYVDVLMVVHPTEGGECGTYHMWSHSWQYSYWQEGGAPLATGDDAAGGGKILVEDYIICPALSCDSGVIEIGVFCHELGHVLGLPDLYDTYGGGGIGHWGLMGNGNWNTPESPAHLCGWSKEQLGWIRTREIGWEEAAVSLDPSENGGEILKMVLGTERFRRRPNIFPITGHSLMLGYTEAESEARAWPGGAGYGNGWCESVVHGFTSDGSLPCVFEYDIGADTEQNWDFAYLILESGAGMDTLASYTGDVNPVSVAIDIGERLPPSGGDFTLRFLFASDFNYSDEDGGFDSQDGWALNIDNVALSGGGIDYSCDFETDSGGWRLDSEPAEYFLVEYRKRSGFDRNLHGEGILIWHAENSIAYSELGNSGGASNSQARGVVLEEADGDYDLLSAGNPQNYGDDSDPFPGRTGNTAFTTSTLPSSRSNGSAVTPVSVTAVSGGSAVLRAGMSAPSAASIQPDVLSKGGGPIQLFDIRGDGILPGAVCSLARGGTVVNSSAVTWLGKNRILASFGVSALFSGKWDLIVRSGDGQEALLSEAVDVASVFESVSYTVTVSDILFSWVVDAAAGVTGCLLERSPDGENFQSLTQDTLRSASGEYSYTDGTLEGRTGYYYRITAFFPGGDERLSIPGPLSLERPFALEGARPNPFRSAARIFFYTPVSTTLAIDFYDAAGRRVSSLGSMEYGRGTQVIEWDPAEEGLAAGVYFCVLRSGSVAKSVKLVYIP